MTKPTAAHSRFLCWVDWMRMDHQRAEIALKLGVSDAMLYALGVGRRKPSRHVALRIERETKGWKDGPIKATEWPRTKRGGRRV